MLTKKEIEELYRKTELAREIATIELLNEILKEIKKQNKKVLK